MPSTSSPTGHRDSRPSGPQAGRARLIAAVCSLALGLGAAGGAPAPAAEQAVWDPATRDAREYAEDRRGEVSFATVDEGGRLRGHHERSRAPAASVFKAMLLVTYLRRGSVRDRELDGGDRDLLEPMIRWSDSATATRVRDIVGTRAIENLARRAGMSRFSLHDVWGPSRTSAEDQARFFWRLEKYVPSRHRAYARNLLETIVSSQRWGVAEASPPGWRLFFKGGWGSGSGRVDHQVAFLKDGDRRIAVAIFTEHNPSHDYAKRTLRGVSERLFDDLRG